MHGEAWYIDRGPFHEVDRVVLFPPIKNRALNGDLRLSIGLRMPICSCALPTRISSPARCMSAGNRPASAILLV